MILFNLSGFASMFSQTKLQHGGMDIITYCCLLCIFVQSVANLTILSVNVFQHCTTAQVEITLVMSWMQQIPLSSGIMIYCFIVAMGNHRKCTTSLIFFCFQKKGINAPCPQLIGTIKETRQILLWDITTLWFQLQNTSKVNPWENAL